MKLYIYIFLLSVFPLIALAQYIPPKVYLKHDVAVNHRLDVNNHYNQSLFPSIKKGYVEFSYSNSSHYPVYLTGDFANWRQNAYWMSYNDRVYQVRVKLKKGRTYHYKFITPVGSIEDPSNPEMVDDGIAGFCSVIHIDNQSKIKAPINNKIFHRRSESEHFILLTKSNQITNTTTIERILSKCEGIYCYLTNFLELDSPPTAKIIIRYRQQSHSKAVAVRVGNTITYTSHKFSYGIIAHELTHLLAGQAKNMFLSEGLAMFVQSIVPQNRSENLYTSAKNLKQNNKLMSLEKLITVKSFINHPNKKSLYLQAGAFYKYLFDTYDKSKILRYYYSGSESIFGIENLAELQEKYETYLSDKK